MGKTKKAIKWKVLLPPWIVVMGVLVLNLSAYDTFTNAMSNLVDWILGNFAWMFNYIALAAILLAVIAYFSPLKNVRIGGRDALPIISYRSYIWIVLCTIMGSGLMMWACAEPVNHIHNPSAGVHAGAMSGDAILWAMENIFLEWTFSPMAIYALPSLLFAFVFYNMKQEFSVGSMFAPLTGKQINVQVKEIIDSICLFCLCMGLSSSLGSGILLIVQGASHVTGGFIQTNLLTYSLCGLAIIICYIVSASSGLKRGITYLSTINAYFYLVIGIFVLLAGPTAYILNLSCEALGAYLSDFFRLSLQTSTAYGDGWSLWWTQFYWCTWLTWMPISAVFLGKISRGYTVSEVLNVTFLIPSIFSIIWLSLFSGTTIHLELNEIDVFEQMQLKGIADAAFTMLDQLPLKEISGPLFLITAFISYVTCADSNIHAMASLCTNGLTPDDTESPVSLKLLWGATIGILCIVMLNAFGIDGMKMLADLGGFLSAFLMILFLIAFVIILKNPGRFDKTRD